MSFPKVEDVQKNLELAKKVPNKHEYDATKSMLTVQIMEMAKHGETALHTEEFKRLNGFDGKMGSEMIDELKVAGYTVRETDIGHQIEWPAKEIKEPKTEDEAKAAGLIPDPT